MDDTVDESSSELSEIDVDDSSDEDGHWLLHVDGVSVDGAPVVVPGSIPVDCKS
jgi:hypothetical protein